MDDYFVYPGLSTRFELAKIHRSLFFYLADRILKVTGIPYISQVDRLVGIKRMRLMMMNSNSKLYELVLQSWSTFSVYPPEWWTSIDAKTSWPPCCSVLFQACQTACPKSLLKMSTIVQLLCITESFYMMSVIPVPFHKLPSATCPSNWWFQIPRHSHQYIACLHKLAMGHGDILSASLVARVASARDRSSTSVRLQGAKMAEMFWSDCTLWWTNIAIENGHL